MNEKIHRYIVVTVGLLCCMGLGFSTAFISRRITAKNIITFGSVKIQLHETCLDGNGIEVAFNPDSVTKLTSKEVQNRIFRVENISKHPLYVRLSFSVLGTDRDGEKFDTRKCFRVNTELKEWIYQDGWYYYDSILESGEKTEALVADMICDMEQILSCYPGSNFELSVQAQAVQSEYNQLESVILAEGWPEL